ncbi:hypothetical protein EDC04DRAFT_2677527 [Pisolithus marmoratus]|nr:hypothetical protein EDC04DRAFT_2677527 [Pisolithus marmoratus]
MGNGPSSCSRRSSRSTQKSCYPGGFDCNVAKRTFQKPLQPVVVPGDSPPPYSATDGWIATGTSHHSPAAPPSGSFMFEELRPGTLHTRVSMIPPPSASQQRYKDPNYLAKPLRRESRENALETLRKYDTVLIVDDSGSMRGSLWEEAMEALAGLVSIAAEYDSNGIDIHFLNRADSVLGIKDANSVEELFRHMEPDGFTPIGERLETLLSDYLRNLERAQRRHERGDSSALKRIKPVNFIVITDGCPTDDPESVIVAAARRLDAKHFPLTQDIVDTTPYMNMKITADMLIKILLGGINRRVDNRGAQAVMGF